MKDTRKKPLPKTSDATSFSLGELPSQPSGTNRREEGAAGGSFNNTPVYQPVATPVPTVLGYHFENPKVVKPKLKQLLEELGDEFKQMEEAIMEHDIADLMYFQSALNDRM